MKILVALLGLSGCFGWGYGEGVAPDRDPEWEDRVAEAVDIWNSALHLKCGSPAFYIDERDGHPVRRLTLVEWRYKYPDTSFRYSGKYNDWGSSIDVLEQPGRPEAERVVLIHELGHALGLRHVDSKDDPLSIMVKISNPEIYTPSLRDVDNVECP